MRALYILPMALMAASPALAQNLDLGGAPNATPVPVQITASQGISWSQHDNTVTASGNAKAVRGDVTVTADQLIAHYKPKKDATKAQPGSNSLLTQSGTELTELDAVGHVHIYTATDNGWGDHAVYSTAQQLLVLTGKNLKLTTPKDTLTARDSISYYAGEHKAIARGNALITTTDGRSVAADVIIGYFAAQTNKNANGSLEKVDALGHVIITTSTDLATGDKAVYVPATGEARLGGNVHITHGQNHLAGSDALVNMKSGTATLLAAPGGRVSGVILPNSGNAK